MGAAIDVVIAFDVGLARTGVAVANTLSQSARVAGTITVTNGRHDWSRLDALLDEWQPKAAIIGQGSATDPHLTKAINRLISYLQQNYGLKTHQVDECLSTVAANQSMSVDGIKSSKRKLLRDQYAACILLDNWLASQ